MNWYRSWPTEVPPGRAYIADGLPRLVMSGYDYHTVDGGLPADEPGFCMLEWDVALDRGGRALFAEHALKEPDRVLVAPYRIFPLAAPPVLAHKAAADPGQAWNRQPIPDGQEWAHSFGFGCVYLPQAVLAEWAAAPVRPMRDGTFSDWHVGRYGTVQVDWSVHPQHLHEARP